MPQYLDHMFEFNSITLKLLQPFTEESSVKTAIALACVVAFVCSTDVL